MFPSKFQQAVNDAMKMLADEEGVIFVGQSVKWDGAAIYDSLRGIGPMSRLEMPVVEDFQLGYCIGLSLAGRLPICIYPRMDFMLLAMNQLVNHLDKLPIYGWKPRVIIRAAVGQKKPLDAGPQHTQNFTNALRLMVKRMEVLEVSTPKQVTEAYSIAIRNAHSTVVIENPCESS